MSTSQANLVSPLPEDLSTAVARLTSKLDNAGLWWLSGYAAGLASSAPTGVQPATQANATAHVQTSPDARLTIVYGSQTGNARRIAEQLAADATTAGLDVQLLRADSYRTRDLKHEHYLYLVVSTQGEGDPSDDARELYDFITGKRAPRLEQLQYAVLGLGDSSYPQFCAIGQVLDARLAELGAKRLLPRGDADLDIDTVATPWRTQALKAARESLKPLATVTPLRPQVVAPSGAHTREQPFAAPLLANQRITLGQGRLAEGGKDIRHIELSLEGSGLHYEPGDALGIWPRNPAALVDNILSLLRLDGDSAVSVADDTLPLREWLSSKRELTRLARAFLATHAERSGDADLHALLASGNAVVGDWLRQRQLIDVLQTHPGDWSGDALVGALHPLAPRLYSIASSRKAVGDEAHLTVAHVESLQVGELQAAETRWGAASHHLASLAEDETVPAYIEANERFRLPADPSSDIIMIGPGTGVAPFRGFVQERSAIGADGRNWLFFGNTHFRSDFLYQLEWQRALKSGELHRLDLAFSRDGAEKVYVQQRLRERGRDLYDWLQSGAHLYVCGAIAMGKDVHATLLDVVAAHNGGDRDAAATYFDDLQHQGRYARDLY